jgi:hypothetical protein
MGTPQKSFVEKLSSEKSVQLAIAKKEKTVPAKMNSNHPYQTKEVKSN